MTDYLVETDWLVDHLDDPGVRVLEATTILRRGDDGRLRAESGRDGWAESHIPGSVFADLPGDLSDKNATLRFMMPPPEQFAEAMSSYGVGDDTRVVLYDRAAGMWAARVWWMLRAFGFENAAVLNGGWSKWTAEGRATSDAAPESREATFTARPRPELIANQADVLAATGDEDTYKIVGSASNDFTLDYIEVTSTSPLGSALMKARVGEIVRVDLPKGPTQFEILELV